MESDDEERREECDDFPRLDSTREAEDDILNEFRRQGSESLETALTHDSDGGDDAELRILIKIRRASGHLCVMPEEIVVRVMFYLDPVNLYNLGYTCKRMQTILQEDSIWKNIFFAFKLRQHNVFKRAKKKGSAWVNGPYRFQILRLCNVVEREAMMPTEKRVFGRSDERNDAARIQHAALMRKIRQKVLRYSVLRPPDSNVCRFCPHLNIDGESLVGDTIIKFKCHDCGWGGQFYSILAYW